MKKRAAHLNRRKKCSPKWKHLASSGQAPVRGPELLLLWGLKENTSLQIHYPSRGNTFLHTSRIFQKSDLKLSLIKHNKLFSCLKSTNENWCTESKHFLTWSFTLWHIIYSFSFFKLCFSDYKSNMWLLYTNWNTKKYNTKIKISNQK